MFGRFRSGVRDLYVSGQSTYTTEHAPIQLQENIKHNSLSRTQNALCGSCWPCPAASFQVDPKRLKSDVPDPCVSGESTYTTEHAPIQLQEISNIMTSAVPRTSVTGRLWQLLAVGCGFSSGGGRIKLRPPEECLDDSEVMSQILM